jgi:hypothetical protein
MSIWHDQHDSDTHANGSLVPISRREPTPPDGLASQIIVHSKMVMLEPMTGDSFAKKYGSKNRFMTEGRPFLIAIESAASRRPTPPQSSPAP